MRRIFVSSIQRDYSEIRQAVAAAIQALGFEPLMAETAAASPRSPRGALLGLVREADAVTLIIGPRYGAPAEGGLSPTEEEFNEAVASGKPVIVWFTTQRVSAPRKISSSACAGVGEKGACQLPLATSTTSG